MSRRGLLIAVEGVNGAGKSTMISHMMNRINALGGNSSVFKFPNRSGACGEQIDRYLKGDNTVFKTKYDMLSAFAVNKQAEVKSILDDLEQGYVVFCDRYIMSGIAYHIPLDATIPTISAYYHALGYFDVNLPMPDLTLLIIGDHLEKRGDVAERFHHNKIDKMVNIFHSLLAIDCSHNGTVYKIVTNKTNRCETTAYETIDEILGPMLP
jgi:thymidylate kinase